MTRDKLSSVTIHVWDLPTRLFHWTLVALVALTWATGEGEGILFDIHKLAGYGVLAAILFRLIWGFIGCEHARFRDFLHPWPVVRDYAKGLLALQPRPTIGHNPLGGWMIVLLLITLFGMVGTGLFAFEDDVGGPLADSISPQMAHALAEVHEGFANFLLFLIGIHIAGVLVDSLLMGHNLVWSMFSGRKVVSPHEGIATTAGHSTPSWYSAVVLAVAMGITWLVVA